jgi:HAD superfamily hydrolase (TIGR01509 family)
MIDSSIKNIIFDFGGVILNINPGLTFEKFNQLGFPALFDVNDLSRQDETLLMFEKGLISPEEFRKKIREKIARPLSDEQIDEAWNAMLLDLPEDRIKLLVNLKNKYNLYLLSNTNEIHYLNYTRQLKLKYAYNRLSELFKGVCFSFQVHLSKPGREIYEHMILVNSLIPAETLFIDDSEVNIEGAKLTGLKTHHLKTGENLIDLFV